MNFHLEVTYSGQLWGMNECPLRGGGELEGLGVGNAVHTSCILSYYSIPLLFIRLRKKYQTTKHVRFRQQWALDRKLTQFSVTSNQDELNAVRSTTSLPLTVQKFVFWLLWAPWGVLRRAGLGSYRLIDPSIQWNLRKICISWGINLVEIM